MNARIVLIFCADSLAAALIGAAVELAGFQAEFPDEDEPPREAVLRLRPRVALVDCDHEDACTESFFGPALMIGARVAVFSSKRSHRALQPIAATFNVRLFTLPVDVADLNALIADLARIDEA